MANSPTRLTLYRRAGWAVIWAAVAWGALAANAQFAKKETRSKGPRALGLLQLSPNGKDTLAPIAIMVDGKFYDASAYKASPVPMALESGTVYEAFRTGNSLGLFTVTSALTGNGRWRGAGTWVAAGATPPSTAHKAESKPRFEEEEGPPKLRKGKPGESVPAESKPSTPPSSPPSPAAGSPPSPAEPTPPPTAPSTPAPTPSPAASEPSPPDDADRPQLHRGIPPKNAKPKPTPTAGPSAPAAPRTSVAKPKISANTAENRSAVQLVPAISDAGGPDPRSYIYEMKPEEEQVFRKKIVALAAEEIRKQAQETQAIGGETPLNRKRAETVKPATPDFQDVTLHVFDVASNNEPVLVLTAKAAMPAKTGLVTPEYYVTLVARSDLYGELRKLFSAVTDQSHLDVTPRMDLIDAVDADGDGRGELLFRETSDAGTSYAIYRVGADQLWALYEGGGAR